MRCTAEATLRRAAPTPSPPATLSKLSPTVKTPEVTTTRCQQGRITGRGGQHTQPRTTQTSAGPELETPTVSWPSLNRLEISRARGCTALLVAPERRRRVLFCRHHKPIRPRRPSRAIDESSLQAREVIRSRRILLMMKILGLTVQIIFKL